MQQGFVLPASVRSNVPQMDRIWYIFTCLGGVAQCLQHLNMTPHRQARRQGKEVPAAHCSTKSSWDGQEV